ncbi:MAG TPA: SLC13 family permease [Chthoniobacterales bacterium]|jgi:di/tricarboxylate transporter|nr:SLC13 family permease [Chthoniobacterales bacterium]
MTLPIAFVLLLLVVAVALFATERISVDIITFLLLIALVVGGVLGPKEAFAGFSNDIIIILGAIFVISGALQETGVLDLLGARILKLAGTNPNRLLLLLTSSTAGVSAFMNNTTVTAMFLPPTIGVARRAKLSASRLLMPMAFASILGGTCTLIGTSTNVAVSGYIKQAGLPELGMFEITPIGLVIVAIGIAYLMLIGKHMLPEHPPASLTADYAMREYVSEIIILPNSPLIGQNSYDSDLNVLEFEILQIIRGESKMQPSRQVELAEGDILQVKGKADTLMKVKKIEGIEIRPELKLGDLDLQTEQLRIAEVLLTPQSELHGRNLKHANFRQHSGLTVLAIFRHGHSLREQVSDTILRVGDLLLVQGEQARIEALRGHQGLSLLGQVSEPLYHPRKGLLTIFLFGAAVIIGGFGWVPLSIAFLLAAVLTILMRCISVERAYEFVDWRLLVLIGGMTAFGTAMDKTGAASYLAGLVVHWFAPFGILAIVAGFFILTIILTQPMSNAAAALVVLPVAMSAAQQLGANQRTFAIAIMLAASVSFITPFEPSCILVYGPGKYRFMDFVKVGLGLTVVLTVAVLALLQVFWPL